MAKCALFLSFFFLGTLPAVQPGTITVESQEWKETPVRHLAVHGTLNGDTLFRVLLPAKEIWSGRIIHWLTGGSGHSFSGKERGYQDFALERGAVFVESTQGNDSQIYEADDTLPEQMYEASYAVFQYAKARSVEVYGKEPRYSYLFGSSGGGIRGSGLFERFPGLYDGSALSVAAGTFRFVDFYGTLFDYYSPILASKVEAMADAVGVNGTGDPFFALTSEEEKDALRMVLTAGLPKMLISQLTGRFGLSRGRLVATRTRYDPAYYDDFWERGYGGEEAEDRVVEGISGVVKEVDLDAGTLRFEAPGAPAKLAMFSLRFESGAAAGQSRWIRERLREDLIQVLPSAASIAPGDRFTIDNRDKVAFSYYYRFIAPDDPAARDLFKDGKPLYPRRPPEAMRYLAETDRTLGDFEGKLITVFGTEDRLAWPTYADHYRRAVIARFGDAAEDHHRNYFVQRAPHGLTPGIRQVSYLGLLFRAQDDLIAWVEGEVSPAPSTRYQLDSLSQLVLPAAATERKGYQPVVRVLADGREHRIDVAVGQDVQFEILAEDPDNELVEAEIDFDGDGRYDQRRELAGRKAKAAFSFRYDRPGSYVAAGRVTDATATRHGAISNLAAVEVLVQ